MGEEDENCKFTLEGPFFSAIARARSLEFLLLCFGGEAAPGFVFGRRPFLYEHEIK
jgi:hypothetical protein